MPSNWQFEWFETYQNTGVTLVLSGGTFRLHSLASTWTLKSLITRAYICWVFRYCRVRCVHEIHYLTKNILNFQQIAYVKVILFLYIWGGLGEGFWYSDIIIFWAESVCLKVKYSCYIETHIETAWKSIERLTNIK